jgi:Transcriptional regulator, AbiEi antitoxin
MQQQGRTAEQKLARLAGAAHGIVTREQLLGAGLSPEEIRQRLRSGALLREYRGVYRVGHRAPSVEARYLAAVWACGRGAVLSGRAAGHLLEIITTPPSMPEVTAPTERRVPGIRTRRSREPIDAMIWRGIPVTTPARTLVDLSSVLAVSDLARACHEAGIRFGTAPGEVEAILGRRRGARELRRVLWGDVHVSLSALERRFLALLRQAGLPLPVTNRPAGGRYVDCRWPHQRLTVELDGYRYHSSRHAWELDRRREREAYARGDDFRRYTWGDVYEDPRAMLRELRSVL